MVQVADAVLLGGGHGLDADQVAAVVEVDLEASGELADGQAVEGHDLLAAVLGEGHLGGVPAILGLFHLFFAAHGVIGVGIPLEVQGFAGGQTLFPLGVDLGTDAGNHLELGVQVCSQVYPGPVGLVAQIKNAGDRIVNAQCGAPGQAVLALPEDFLVFHG